ncbi:hypothetical protein TNCV_408991 [Trichonephila clavipes]|nr:hypothetical protein TNCV_408991 [Trichonephila clavipes]
MGSFHHRFPTESGEFESSKSGFRRLRGFPSSFRGRHLTRAPSRNQSLRGRSFTTALSKKTRIAKIPEGSELAKIVANDAKVTKLAANLVSKNDANLALPPRFRQVLIEPPL